MGVRLRAHSTWTEKSKGVEALFEFDAPRIVIGRGAGADVQLPHPAVSSAHCTIRTEGSRYVIVDEGSTNGTTVNGSKLVAGRAKPLRSGDSIELGGFSLTFEIHVVAQGTSADKTGALAQMLLRDILHAQPDRDSEPSLSILNGSAQGECLVLPEAPCSLIVGRGEDCDLRLDDADASREHAEIIRDASSVTLRDLGSKNGVEVNGSPVRGERHLVDRDEIKLGATLVVFEDPTASVIDELRGGDDIRLQDLPPMWEPPPPPEPEPAPEPEPEQQCEADEEEAISMEVHTSPPPRRSPGARTDVLIYVLAGTVLALSLAGLVWLLQAG